MKDDLPFFSHDNDASNNKRMKALRAQYDWAGYGRFWALNEAIAREHGARLDLSMRMARASLASDLSMTLSDFDAFLSFLADPEECGLISYENGIVTTERTQKDYARVMADRLRKRQNGKPVNRYFPDENTDTLGASAPEQQNGTPESGNGVEKHRRQDKTREEKNRKDFLGAESEFASEDFAQSEKSDREKSVENSSPEEGPSFSPPDDLEPIAGLRIPSGVKFTDAELGELFHAVGFEAQRHLDRYALAKTAKDYGYRNDWAGLRYFWDRAGGPDAWLMGSQTPQREELSPRQQEAAARVFKAPSDAEVLAVREEFAKAITQELGQDTG